ncbi:UDP-2,4-diacetamido-2,4,6-trideoxy-beta-L-altropyranose hydrolase [Robertmurraya massiliosenegalensis]|uniref:UDP-2,4-diacetamido-2,4, 6-trideoxy-beta-L-altropyranose hydrolase n=1 Tax=Robertmurraya TaxID=2837507 RepID=UPI0039A59867
MKIVFRVDASSTIGTGHIMRCLTLANFLKENGARVTFVCAELEGNMIDYVKSFGFEVIVISGEIEQDAMRTAIAMKDKEFDLLVVDHYQIDIYWEKTVKEELPSVKLMVIDDLANRRHDCDLLLDQNYQENFESRYDHLVPQRCEKLLGPPYLLLRPEFYKENRVRQTLQVSNILVFYGGADPTGETVNALHALDELLRDNIQVHVVVGLSNSQKDLIKSICLDKCYHYYEQIDYLADLMRESDLSLGAGGVTMWERCYLGLPSIVTIVAENQKESTIATAKYGAIWNLGWHEGVKQQNLVDIIKRAIEFPEKLRELSIKSKLLMQSNRKHEIHPVVKAILEVTDDN